MGGIKRVFVGLSGLAAFGHATNAYGSCSSSPPTDCWKDWNGSNPSLIDVGPGVICTAAAGDGGTRYNDSITCMSAGPNGGAPLAVAPPPNMGSIIKNQPGKRVKSLAIGNATATRGPVALYVLLEDNNLYRSTADSRFRNGLDNFTNLVLVNQPIDAGTNQALSFRNISGVHPPVPQSFYPIAVGTNAVVYWPSGDKWRPIPSMSSANYFMGYGGPFAAIFLKGTSGSSETIAIRLRTNPDSEALLPPIPSGIDLFLAPNFNSLGPTQPIALGTEDAWIVTNHLNADTFIKRSTLTNGVWSAWASYPTAPLPSPGATFPWTLVDARELRGIRGNLIGIGATFRLLEYFPP